MDWGDKFDPTQLRLLYLFSGKSKGHHSFEAQAQARGHLAECHDNTREPPTNLQSDLERAAIDEEIDNDGVRWPIGITPLQDVFQGPSQETIQPGTEIAAASP